MARRLKLVPWEPTWLAHQTLDLKAVYRRPQRYHREGDDTWYKRRDDHGFQLWDLTPPMTIRNHYAYLQKGFEYVTLGDIDSVTLAGNPHIAEKGATPLGMGSRANLYPNERADDYIRQGAIRGPWNIDVYKLDLADEFAEHHERLRKNIASMGPENAEAFERQRDPGYVLPEAFKRGADPVQPPPKKRGRPRKHPQPEATEEAAATA